MKLGKDIVQANEPGDLLLLERVIVVAVDVSYQLHKDIPVVLAIFVVLNAPLFEQLDQLGKGGSVPLLLYFKYNSQGNILQYLFSSDSIKKWNSMSCPDLSVCWAFY